MAKQADATDLKSVGEIHIGSNPITRTTWLRVCPYSWSSYQL